MSGKIRLIRFTYAALFLILVIISLRFIIWERIKALDNLREELELSERLYNAREANYASIEANQAVLDQYAEKRSELTGMNEITAAALYVGELLHSFGLAEISSFYDKLVVPADNSGLSVVITEINSVFIGEYESVIKFLQAIKNERYAYFFDMIQLSSAGMRVGHVSAKVELLLYSVYTPNVLLFDLEVGGLNFEEHGYENPFYYAE